MTKFFIPAADSPEQERSVYASIKQFLGEQLGATFSDRHVRSLRWVREGQDVPG